MLTSRFEPHDADFCFASIHGLTDNERHNFATRWLLEWLKFQVGYLGARGVVVFDIDDTLMDNEGAPIDSVLRIYDLAKTLGLHRAIVTARPETIDNRQYTVESLKEIGVNHWESLYMMPESRDITTESVSSYKREARDDIETRHRIIANIGDMWHDLVQMPLHHSTRCLEQMSDDACCILFPPMSHGEVALKLVSRARERAHIKMMSQKSKGEVNKPHGDK
tara:strand:+ start:541 stop:1206 length:666 start_codon:yes stop_codon:yes gene_type:complete